MSFIVTGQVTVSDVRDGSDGNPATQTAEGIVYFRIAQSSRPGTTQCI